MKEPPAKPSRAAAARGEAAVDPRALKAAPAGVAAATSARETRLRARDIPAWVKSEVKVNPSASLCRDKAMPTAMPAEAPAEKETPRLKPSMKEWMVKAEKAAQPR